MSPYPASLDTMRIARLEGRAMREYEMGIHYGNSAHLGNSIKHLEDSYKALHSKTPNIEGLLTAMRNPASIMSPTAIASTIANLRRATGRSSTRSRSRSSTPDSTDSDGYGTPPDGTPPRRPRRRRT
jgi:hypothetical protein